MNLIKELVLITSVSCCIFGIIIYRPDPTTFLKWAVKGVALLGFVAFIIHQLDRVWQKIKSSSYLSQGIQSGKSAEEVREKETVSRSNKQSEYSDQAEDYKENVLKPKEEQRQKLKEEEYYRFAGPAWKGKGYKLGGEEDEDLSQQDKMSSLRKRGSSKEAAEARKLPESVDQPTASQETQQPKPVHEKITLPEEPENGEGVITLSFRTPLRVHRRRFCITDTVQLLLDFITTLGYHQKIYSLCTSYPRICLSSDPSQTLAEVGITTGCTLNVEEKE